MAKKPDEIYQLGNKWAFKCAGCNKVEGGFSSEKEAKTALRIHQINDKDSIK